MQMVFNDDVEVTYISNDSIGTLMVAENSPVYKAVKHYEKS